MQEFINYDDTAAGQLFKQFDQSRLASEARIQQMQVDITAAMDARREAALARIEQQAAKAQARLDAQAAQERVATNYPAAQTVTEEREAQKSVAAAVIPLNQPEVRSITAQPSKPSSAENSMIRDTLNTTITGYDLVLAVLAIAIVVLFKKSK